MKREVLRLFLDGEAATLALGGVLGRALAGGERPPALLLSGPLGAGKTTLVRGLVAALPGADAAEVASPSFNVYNLYPTTPEVLHADLYRLEGMPLPEELEERMADESALVVIEWSEHLSPSQRPENALEVALAPAKTGRSAEISAWEGDGLAVLTMLRSATPF